MLFAQLLLALLVVLSKAQASPVCKDHFGNEVEMFIVYKLPKITTSPNPHVKSGTGYLYLDSSHKTFELSPFGINEPQNALRKTLDQVYKWNPERNFVHAFYNDQPPVGTASSAYGRTKGALAFDKHKGFWLISSVPEFPAPIDWGYRYPPTAQVYGQTLICITFQASAFESIAMQLLYNHAYMYDKNMPTSYYESHPTVKKLLFTDKETLHKYSYSVTYIRSIEYRRFKSFAKDRRYGADLYSVEVAPVLQTGLWTETWQRGHKSGIFCEGFPVVDITSIQIKLGGHYFTEFRSSRDHSKFAISKSHWKPWVCIGDINRMTTHYHRGGGTLCFADHEIWQQYVGFIKTAEQCPPNAEHIKSKETSAKEGETEAVVKEFEKVMDEVLDEILNEDKV